MGGWKANYVKCLCWQISYFMCPLSYIFRMKYFLKQVSNIFSQLFSRLLYLKIKMCVFLFLCLLLHVWAPAGGWNMTICRYAKSRFPFQVLCWTLMLLLLVFGRVRFVCSRNKLFVRSFSMHSGCWAVFRTLEITHVSLVLWILRGGLLTIPSLQLWKGMKIIQIKLRK